MYVAKQKRSYSIINYIETYVIFKLYLALVLEYAAQVWSPYRVKDIQLLEKFGLCICSRCYHLKYEDLLHLFNVPSLENQRLFLSLCTFYSFPPNSIPLVYNSRSNHFIPFRAPVAHTLSLQHSFMHTLLNNIPNDAIASTSLTEFKYFVSPLFL